MLTIKLCSQLQLPPLSVHTRQQRLLFRWRQMQPIIKRCSLSLSDAVGRIDGLHPLRRKRVTIRIALHHIHVMVFHESELPGVAPALQTETDVHANHRIPRLSIEDQNLLEFSHRVFLTLLV